MSSSTSDAGTEQKLIYEKQPGSVMSVLKGRPNRQAVVRSRVGDACTAQELIGKKLPTCVFWVLQGGSERQDVMYSRVAHPKS